MCVRVRVAAADLHLEHCITAGGDTAMAAQLVHDVTHNNMSQAPGGLLRATSEKLDSIVLMLLPRPGELFTSVRGGFPLDRK